MKERELVPNDSTIEKGQLRVNDAGTKGVVVGHFYEPLDAYQVYDLASGKANGGWLARSIKHSYPKCIGTVTDVETLLQVLQNKQEMEHCAAFWSKS